MKRQTILIIDDNPEDRLAARTYLQDNGRVSYQIYESAKGEDGIRAALSQRPDCILLDQCLPDTDGLDVLKHLCDERGDPQFAVVIMTGFHDETVITAAIQGGAQDYIDKAKLSPELLKQTVRGAMARFRLVSSQKRLEARYRAIVSDSADAIISFNLDGVIETWNAAAEVIFGWLQSEAVAQSLEKFTVPSDNLFAFRESLGQLRGGKAVRCETVRLRKNGEVFDASLTMTPLIENGRPVSVSAIIRDVTEIKEGEKKRNFLLQELAHRSKNMMSIIQAIAHHTARSTTTTSQFIDKLEQRLAALAASQDLLVSEGWAGIPVAELIRAQLAPFAEIDGLRVVAEGPLRLLLPEAAQSIGLALHELATNATKYGSLSVPSGKVEISWRLELECDKRFCMSWRESGGPKVSPPAQKGFGHMVIERMVGQSLKGNVQVDFNPQGLVWSMNMPAEFTAAE